MKFNALSTKIFLSRKSGVKRSRNSSPCFAPFRAEPDRVPLLASRMSSWKSAGFSFLRYANTCAIFTRRALKEPYATKALERDTVNMKAEHWIQGRQQDKVPFKSATELAPKS